MKEAIKTNNNKKFIKWLIILIIIPLIIIAIHFHFYFFLKDTYHAKESANPKATAYFLHTSAITVSWINILHRAGMAYDNPIMKPIISMRDYYFNLGEKYVNEDNAENVIWWSYNYSRMYGFAIGDDNNVYAINKLDIQAQRKLRDKMYNYIIRLGTHEVKGIQSINNDPLSDMTGLISGYLFWITEMYEGKTGAEKAKNFYHDKKMSAKLQNIYKYYYQASIKSLLLENKKLYHAYFRFRLLQFMIFGNMVQNTTFNESLCQTAYIDDYINLFDKLLKWADNSHDGKSEGEERIAQLFQKIALSNNPNKVSTHILEGINMRCTNYPQAKEFLKLKNIKGKK